MGFYFEPCYAKSSQQQVFDISYFIFAFLYSEKSGDFAELFIRYFLRAL
jgi:hypothetical protein